MALRLPSMLRFGLLLLALVVFSSAQAQTTGKLTYVEGQVQVIRGAQALAAVAGLPLESSDIVETGSNAYVLLEFGNGMRLALGGDTRLMLRSLGSSKDGTVEFATLGGWLKAQSGTAEKDPGYRIDTPTLSVRSSDASLVLRVGAETNALFVESGAATAAVLDRRGRAGTSKALRRGNFLTQPADHSLVVRERPGQEFVAALPRPFRDPLPDLLDHFRNRPVNVRILGDADYASAGPWLQGPRTWRAGLVPRFSSRARDPEFRRGLVENLKLHSEWSRILYPERYRKH